MVIPKDVKIVCTHIITDYGIIKTMTKHKHAELIKQWADNKDLKIQYQKYQIGDSWVDVKDPLWQETTNYRIKPESIKLKYRVGLFSDKLRYWTNTFDSSQSYYKDIANNIYFVKWITEEQEIIIDKD